MTIKDSGAASDNLPLAVTVIVFTVLALSLGDALIKLGSANFVLWQIFVIRSVIAVPFLVGLMWLTAPRALQLPNAVGWVVLRSLLLVVMWISYYVSLPYLPLSVAAAAFYTLPIFITLFSAMLTGEKIHPSGWLAVVLGFIGVLLILRPAAGEFNFYALLPLLSAILYALAMILTRTRCRQQHPLSLSLALNLMFILIGGAVTLVSPVLLNGLQQEFLVGEWVSMNGSQWLAMGLMAMAILIGSIGTAFAYQNAPSSIIGVFDFAYVGFAVIWGLIFFAERPDAISVTGMLLIVVSGVLSLRHQ